MALCSGIPAQAVVEAPAPAVPKVEPAPEFGNFTVEVSTKVGLTHAGGARNVPFRHGCLGRLAPGVWIHRHHPGLGGPKHLGIAGPVCVHEIQGEHCWNPRSVPYHGQPRNFPRTPKRDVQNESK